MRLEFAEYEPMGNQRLLQSGQFAGPGFQDIPREIVGHLADEDGSVEGYLALRVWGVGVVFKSLASQVVNRPTVSGRFDRCVGPESWVLRELHTQLASVIAAAAQNSTKIEYRVAPFGGVQDWIYLRAGTLD